MVFGDTLNRALALRKAGSHAQSYIMLKKACKENDPYACYIMYIAYNYGGWTVCLNKRKSHKYYEKADQLKCPWTYTNRRSSEDNYAKGLICKANHLWDKAAEFFNKALDEDKLTLAAYDVWETTNLYSFAKIAAQYGDCRAQYAMLENYTSKDIADQGFSKACICYASDRKSKEPWRYVAMSRDWKFIRKRLRMTQDPKELCYYGQICTRYRKKHHITPDPYKFDHYWEANLKYELAFEKMKSAMMTFFLCVPLCKDIRKLIWDFVYANIYSWSCKTSQYNVSEFLPIRRDWTRLFIKMNNSNELLCDVYLSRVFSLCAVFGFGGRIRFTRNRYITIWEGPTTKKEYVIYQLQTHFCVEFIKENLPIKDYCI